MTTWIFFKLNDQHTIEMMKFRQILGDQLFVIFRHCSMSIWLFICLHFLLCCFVLFFRPSHPGPGLNIRSSVRMQRLECMSSVPFHTTLLTMRFFSLFCDGHIALERIAVLFSMNASHMLCLLSRSSFLSIFSLALLVYSAMLSNLYDATISSWHPLTMQFWHYC